MQTEKCGVPGRTASALRGGFLLAAGKSATQVDPMIALRYESAEWARFVLISGIAGTGRTRCGGIATKAEQDARVGERDFGGLEILVSSGESQGTKWPLATSTNFDWAESSNERGKGLNCN